MAVQVEFPDGSIRHVQSYLREVRDNAAQHGARRFVQIPGNGDPDWQYLGSAGQWVARPRRKVAPKAGD